jgi:RNA polymerase sigma-70 factor (ECF subfamily)
MSTMIDQELDWQALIARARQFDPQAFDVLVDEYAPRVRGFLRRLVPGSDLDDAVQEVFLRVVRTFGQYQESGRFDAWIFQIARNLAHDQHRGRARMERQVAGETQHDHAASNAGVGQQLEQAEELVEIESAMLRLPDSEREVILLRHFGKLTFEEIATLTNVPLGTALARSHRGLAKLRQWVAGEPG